MKTYPTDGDDGSARLPDGQQVTKDDLQFDAVGTLDELNSALAVAHCACGSDRDLADAIRRVQHDIFALGAVTGRWTCSPRSVPTTKHLEQDMARWTSAIGPIRDFVLPGGCELAARLDLARTICRRAERAVVRLVNQRHQEVPRSVVPYLNRLGDWLFLAARLANHQAHVPETPWSQDD